MFFNCWFIKDKQCVFRKNYGANIFSNYPTFNPYEIARPIE